MTSHCAITAFPTMNLVHLKEDSLMRRSSLIAVVLLAFGSTLLATPPARAAEYGAIAWDEATGKHGVGRHEPTAKRAAEAAISDCGASGCKVVTTIGPGMCGALAASQGGKKVGAAARKSRDAARVAALKNCPKESGECTIQFDECSK
jgi:hypothetical protein